LAPDQKLCEIPHNSSRTEKAPAGLFKLVEKWVFSLSVDTNLRTHLKAHIVVTLAEFHNLYTSTRLLPTKLITRKTEDFKALLLV
jgi:hypothetical protein